MRDLDQGDRTLSQRAAEQVRGAVLGNHPMHVGPEDRDGLGRIEVQTDRGPALGGARGEADDSHTAW